MDNTAFDHADRVDIRLQQIAGLIASLEQSIDHIDPRMAKNALWAVSDMVEQCQQDHQAMRQTQRDETKRAAQSC